MKKLMLGIAAFIALSGSVLRAQDFTGTWQGTLHAEKDLRIILTVAKADGKLNATMYSIDQGGQPIKASEVTQEGTAVTCTVSLISLRYTGKMSADGNAIEGTSTQGTQALPLNLVRATKETAWEIPPPPAPPKMMAADADPSFDVATIKPNNSGATNMQGLTVRGRNFATRASSLIDLMEFAYGVQAKQIIGGPDWAEKDRYDIAAVPDVEGIPSPQQLRNMIRKLLAERFQLKFHNEKRELPAFVLSISKTGQKLSPTQLNGPLPGIGIQGGSDGLSLLLRNANMSDFTGFLQSPVLDRPVIDETGIAGRFDFSVKFTPDDSQFHGHPPVPPSSDDKAEPAPNLFEAIQQQLGLRLEAKKVQVDVMVLDHVEKPSQN